MFIRFECIACIARILIRFVPTIRPYRTSTGQSAFGTAMNIRHALAVLVFGSTRWLSSVFGVRV